MTHSLFSLPEAGDTRVRMVDVVPALVAAWLGVVSASWAPWSMNPDGVSYLDQAAALTAALVVRPLRAADWRPSLGPWPSPCARAIPALREAGVPAGATIAVAGDPFRAYWAREAGIRIGASLELRRSSDYWRASDDQRRLWDEAFRAAGARVVVITNGQQGVTVVPLRSGSDR